MNLLGSLVNLTGEVVSIRNENPFSQSKILSRQWMVLLKNVFIGEIYIDHLWLDGCKRVSFIKKDKDILKHSVRISLTGIVKTYFHDGIIRWTVKPPYRNVMII